MKYICQIKKRGLLFITFLSILLTANHSFGQLIYQPYSYPFYQKLNKVIYSPAKNLHTALKPYLIGDSSTIRTVYDSLMQNDVDNSERSWMHRVWFGGHMIDIKNKDYTFHFDYLTDIGLGREFSQNLTTNLNTRGYQLAGTVGANFFFYTSGYENQGVFANYVHNYIANVGIVPGQGYDRTRVGDNAAKNSSDWSSVTALIGYAPSKAITIALGEDKTFIGDGYRSVLLSDYASNYPLLRFTANIGKHLQYMAMWAYMEDQNAPQFNSFYNYRRKWGAFHYLDWNITNRASLGFFNALIAAEANDQGDPHGFDVNYINPVLFVSSLGPSGSLADHTLFGFNGKYKLLDKTTVYGQVLIDQSTTSTSSRNAYQVGFRGADLFKVNSLNYLFEFNTAAPYTYSSQNPIVSYAELSEPLAHPFGANFKEWLGIINYSIGKFDFQGQLNYAKYGLNATTINYGKDIRLADNVALPASVQNTTGQGVATSLKYAEGTISFMLNPKYNLRLEVGGLLRQEKNEFTDTKTALITFGLRSSFRNLYHDF